LLLIVGFTAIFYQKYKWDQYEQRYRELLSKRSNDSGTTPNVQAGNITDIPAEGPSND